MGRKRKRKEPRQSKCIYCGKVIVVGQNGRLLNHMLAERMCLGSGHMADQNDAHRAMIDKRAESPR